MQNFFKDRKIGKKLQVAFGAIIAIFIVAIIVAIVSITNINGKMNTFYTGPYVNSTLQMQIRRDVQYIGKQALWAMTTDSVSETQEHLKICDTYTENVNQAVATLKQSFQNQELLKRLDAAWEDVKGHQVEVTELAGANKNDQALVVYNGDYDAAVTEIQNVLQEIGATADTNAENAYESAASLGTFVIILMSVIGVISIVFCLYMGMLITKSIQNPVQELEAAALKLSKGEMDAEITYESKDELGSLANSFRTAFTFMKDVISDTGHILGKVAEGDFTVKSRDTSKYIGEFTKILESMRELVENLDTTMKQINEGSGQVAIGAGQMSESAQTLAEGATEQAGAIEELTATVENVNIMAEDMAKNSEEAAESTKQSAKQAQEGQKSMQDLVAAMENISNVSQEIQNIIGAIEDIASQTNLLSLNASIEAARAGEAGKGFAVVADQIGKLASDSAASAVETRNLIQKSLEEVGTGNEITKRTVVILETIIKDINNFSEIAANSSQGASAQAEMLKQIQMGIEQISEVVQSNSASAQETSATSEELSAQSENLKALVDQFQLRQ